MDQINLSKNIIEFYNKSGPRTLESNSAVVSGRVYVKLKA